jgi:hypothetical protein
MSALAMTACSSGTGSPTVPGAAGSSVTTAVSQSHAMLLAVQCLRQHGILDLPDPTVVPSGPMRGQSIFDKRAFGAYPDPVVNQALAACRAALAQAGVVPRSAPTLTEQEIQNRLALARCLRSHGVPNFPDPNPTTGDITLPPGLTKTSPQLLTAAQACRSLAIAAGLQVPAPGNPGASGG